MTALLVRNRNYRLLFSASAVTNLGDGIAAVALPWLATLFTRDPFLIGMVAMAGRLPWFLFSLPAGVWIDRADRQALMVRAGAVRAGLMLAVVGLILTLPALPLAEGAGMGPVLALAVLAFLLGAAEVVGDNAAQTVLPALVAPDELERANGQMWSAERVAGEFLGPPLAGALIVLGVSVPFGVDVGLFALGAVLLWAMVMPPRALTPPPGWRAAFAEGTRWLRGQPALLHLAIMLGCVNALAMANLTVLVLFAQEVLHLDAVGYGLLLTAGAVGAVLGGLVAPRVTTRLGLKGSMAAGLALFGTGYLMIALTASPYATGAALGLEAFGAMIWNVATVSWRQRIIPTDILGRVNSIYRFFGWGAMPFGALAGGTLVSWASGPLGLEAALRLPFWTATAGCAVLIAVTLTRFDPGPG